MYTDGLAWCLYSAPAQGRVTNVNVATQETLVRRV